MRNRYLVPLGGLCVVGPTLWFLIPRAFSVPVSEDSLGAFDDWAPTPQAIRALVRPGGGGSFTDDRHKTFAAEFQKRFRSHDKAIGVRFDGDDHLKLMCAALIPRWDMAQVALQLHHEAEDIFGKSYDIDIYETYISMQQRKLAEVRKSPTTGHMEVIFDPRFARMANPRGLLVWRMLRARMEPATYLDPHLWFPGSQPGFPGRPMVSSLMRLQ